MTKKQQERIAELRKYMNEVRDVGKADFEKWFAGKKTVATNVLAWLILIEKGE